MDGWIVSVLGKSNELNTVTDKYSKDKVEGGKNSVNLILI